MSNNGSNNNGTADNVRQFTVQKDDDGVRLDRWFKRHLPQVGFATVSRWARTGQIRVDGKRADPADRLCVAGGRSSVTAQLALQRGVAGLQQRFHADPRRRPRIAPGRDDGQGFHHMQQGESCAVLVGEGGGPFQRPVRGRAEIAGDDEVARLGHGGGSLGDAHSLRRSAPGAMTSVK